MRKILLISPHLDDAVLSCGARIAALTATGVTVAIVTVFTSAGENATQERLRLYKARKQDDIKAAALLGAETIHLGYTDAPFRNSRYHNFNTLLFHHRLPEEERLLVQDIAARLAKLVRDQQPDSVYFPLGTGGHIDHHIVYESSLLLPGTAVTGYYEELPYALLEGWSSIRLAHIQAVPVGNEPMPFIRPVAFSATSLSFVKNYITSPEDAALSEARLLAEWELVREEESSGRLWMGNGPLIRYNKEVQPVARLQQKCAAIACYTTEYPTLFGTVKQMQDTLCVGQEGDKYYEISWLK